MNRRLDIWEWIRDSDVHIGGTDVDIDRLIAKCIDVGSQEAFAAGFERGVAHERGKYPGLQKAWERWRDGEGRG